MHCIFCKQGSHSSRSVEHIVPESLGNTTQVLPPGVVCDACNNYFSRKVEGPLLDSGELKLLRFQQVIPSKRKRIPAMDVKIELASSKAIINGRMHRPANRDFMPVLAIAVEKEIDLAVELKGALASPVDMSPPPNTLMSRFLAKCALEALAQRVLEHPLGIDQFINQPQFDLLRRHARYGQPAHWPFHERVLYDQNRPILENGEVVQTVFEYDIFATTPERTDAEGNMVSEFYFVIAIFGVEFAINIAGPEIEGYEIWLREHSNVSPLYWGKNKTE